MFFNFCFLISFSTMTYNGFGLLRISVVFQKRFNDKKKNVTKKKKKFTPFFCLESLDVIRFYFMSHILSKSVVILSSFIFKQILPDCIVVCINSVKHNKKRKWEKYLRALFDDFDKYFLNMKESLSLFQGMFGSEFVFIHFFLSLFLITTSWLMHFWILFLTEF